MATTGTELRYYWSTVAMHWGRRWRLSFFFTIQLSVSIRIAVFGLEAWRNVLSPPRPELLVLILEIRYWLGILKL